MSQHTRSIPTLAALAALLAGTAAHADFADGVSDSIGLIIGGYTLYASQGNREGKQEAKDLTSALLATGATTFALKKAIRSERPDGSDTDSFPSMHVSLSAAFAEVASRHHPKQRWLFDAYVGTMAWSRLELNKHRERDVLVGALLGTAIGKRYSAQHSGWVLGKMSW